MAQKVALRKSIRSVTTHLKSVVSMKTTQAVLTKRKFARKVSNMSLSKDRKSGEQVDALEVMRRGVPMARNAGSMWDHYDFRMFQLTQEHDAIVWSKKSAMTEERIPISAIQRVYDGQSTDTFKADPKKPIEHMSFSIVWTNKDETGKETVEIFDLICCRRSDAVCWTNGIRRLMEDPHASVCNIDCPEQTIDTSLACLLERTRSKQAGRMAWAIPMAIIPIAGIAWLGYTIYYRNEQKRDISMRRLPEIKALIQQINELLKNRDIQQHPFVSGDAPMRIQFVGECYEAAANIKDSVLDETVDAQLHNVAIALAEAQAIKCRLDVIITDANKGKGWFDNFRVSLTALNPFGATEDEAADIVRESSIVVNAQGQEVGDQQV